MAFQSSRSRYMSEINVTPMVDVMLVLLIIFMVAAPMLEQGVDVDLPKTKKSSSVSVDSKPIVLSVNQGGEIFIGSDRVRNLERYLDNLPKDKQILLKADQRIPYGKIADIITIIRTAKFTKLGLVTQEAQK